MPMPVSLTMNSTSAPTSRTSSRISPSDVNLHALPSRLIRIWRSLSSSVTISRSGTGEMNICTRGPASGPTVACTLSITVRSEHGRIARSILRASMREMSSTLAISDSRCLPASSIRRRSAAASALPATSTSSSNISL